MRAKAGNAATLRFARLHTSLLAWPWALGFAAACALATFAARSAESPAATDAQPSGAGAAWPAYGDRALGRRIFEQGQGRDGRTIIARIAGGAVPVQGTTVACASCHGAQGAGGGEAWVNAPDIRGFALRKPYGARRAGGQARPPYDRDGFARALRSGIAPDGVSLDPAMPRFDLADDEIDALLAHLQQLSDARRDEAARPALVLLLPHAGGLAPERLREGLQSCPAVPNAKAPAHTLPALRVMRYASIVEIEPALTAAAREGSAAALFAPYLIGAEADYAHTAFRRELPVLLPMTMHALGDSRVRFALPDLAAQARALIAAKPTDAQGELAVAFEHDTPGREALQAYILDIATQAGWQVRIVEDADAAVADADVAALLALGPMPAPPASVRRGFRLWLPSAYVAPQHLQAWSAHDTEIRIAMPYRPSVDGDDARLIPPIDAWVAIGCELMTHLPPLPEHASAIDAWRKDLDAQPELRLGEWVRLPAAQTADQAASRVHVMAWPPGR